MKRTRRAEQELDTEAERRPLYARMLRLRHLTPSGLLCFVFLEGAIALGLLLALAELVSWWGVLVLPATVAVMVKLNDVIAGSLSQQAAMAARRMSSHPAGPQAHPHSQAAPQLDPHGPAVSQFDPHGPAVSQFDPHGPAVSQFDPHGAVVSRPDLYGAVMSQLDPYDAAVSPAEQYGSAASQAGLYGSAAPPVDPYGSVEADPDEEAFSPAAAALNPAAAGMPIQCPSVRLADAATTRLPRVLDREHDSPPARPWPERGEAQQQWLRQSATRRYE